ncbi:MAG: response regulator transcription factor [Anaerolineae bacterium]|nr:response regulator transcription factor [Anaerolineae bacterium]
MHKRDTLTKQEHMILELVSKGLRNSKIAVELFISTRTVETHLHNIYSKLGVSCRTEAALHFWNSTTRAYQKIRESIEDSAVRDS